MALVMEVPLPMACLVVAVALVVGFGAGSSTERRGRKGQMMNTGQATYLECAFCCGLCVWGAWRSTRERGYQEACRCVWGGVGGWACGWRCLAF